MELKALSLLMMLLLAVSGSESQPQFQQNGYRRLRPPQLQCTSTSQCPGRQCCRNEKGDLVGSMGESHWATVLGNGTCTMRLSGPGQVCEGCGCVRGYECYRTVTGACCPPRTCWLKEEAERDREFWRNCRPPTCHFPPSVNPAGSGGMGLN